MERYITGEITKMKIGIIFGSDREKATKEIVEWLQSRLEKNNFEVILAGPDDYDHFECKDCNAYIVGTAVYAFRPWGPFLAFLEQNQELFENIKRIATFVVCGLPALNRFLYMWRVKRRLPIKPISEEIFKGYGDERGDFEKREKDHVLAWADTLAQEFSESE